MTCFCFDVAREQRTSGLVCKADDKYDGESYDNTYADNLLQLIYFITLEINSNHFYILHSIKTAPPRSSQENNL